MNGQSRKGMVFSVQRYSLHDGPGIRTTVFLKGCPLRCIWCHNPESKRKEPELLFDPAKCVGCGRCSARCPVSARLPSGGKFPPNRDLCTGCGECADVCLFGANEVKGVLSDTEQILSEVKRDSPFYEVSGGGMTLSGGEPAMQEDFSLALIRGARAAGISCAMETSGMGRREFYLAAAREEVLFLYDIKALDDRKHREFCGASNDLILKNLEALFSAGAKVILRLPLIPGYNDSPEDLALLRDFLSSHAGNFMFAEILPYHALGTAKEVRLGLRPAAIESGEGYVESWLAALSGDGYTVMPSSA